MKKALLLLTCLMLQSCTLNLGVTDTHGTSENVDNDDLQTDVKPDIKATIPLTGA